MFDTLEEAKQFRDNYELEMYKKTGKYMCHEISCWTRKTLVKKYKKLKLQLKEANDCINSAQLSLRGYMLKINEYKKKWGVK